MRSKRKRIYHEEPLKKLKFSLDLSNKDQLKKYASVHQNFTGSL